MMSVMRAVRDSLAVVLDIEATSLYADYGHILCAVVKPIDGDAIVLRLDDYHDRPTFDDSPLLADLIKILGAAPMVVGWNIDRYDLPYIRTRKMIWRAMGVELPSATTKSYDMLRLRRKYRLHANRLGTWMDNLQAGKKTDVLPLEWRQASYLIKDGMDYVVQHCIADVEGTERLFRVLWAYEHGLKPREVVI
ncbi:MAG: hypothetical protein D6750_06270 [Bacteroidetes bacterium]|nr:MAG: hypothetical protein D6750_06270 [Bacteroidota bacterium]